MYLRLVVCCYSFACYIVFVMYFFFFFCIWTDIDGVHVHSCLTPQYKRSCYSPGGTQGPLHNFDFSWSGWEVFLIIVAAVLAVFTGELPHIAHPMYVVGLLCMRVKFVDGHHGPT